MDGHLFYTTNAKLFRPKFQNYTSIHTNVNGQADLVENTICFINDLYWSIEDLDSAILAGYEYISIHLTYTNPNERRENLNELVSNIMEGYSASSECIPTMNEFCNHVSAKSRVRLNV